MQTPVDAFAVRAVHARRANANKRKTNSVLDFIGNTPIVELKRIVGKSAEKTGKNRAQIFAKLEFLNPSGSIKDRMVLYALEAAEKRGMLKKGRGMTLVEATSGNTGVALSMIASVKGYHTIIVMPETTSKEKIKMIKAFGAKLIFTSAEKGMAEPVRLAEEIARKKKAFLLNQFENPDNAKAHETTGREILNQMKRLKKNVDAFVAGIGTGGTLIGVAKVLKKKNPKTKIVAVEPAAVPAFYNMLYGKRLPVKGGIAHKIEGIGEGFVPKILSRKKNRRLVNDVILVKDEEAIRMTKKLANEEGLFVGISSGANVLAALKLAKKLGKGKNIVTVLPDTGQRYLSSGIFKK